MCVPTKYRSLRGTKIDSIIDYIEQKTGLCKLVAHDRLKRAFISRDGSLRKKCEKESSFRQIWKIVDEIVEIPEMKWAYDEINDQAMPGGGFQELLISLGLCKSIPQGTWTVTAKCNLLFYIGVLALDRAAIDKELP